MALSVLLMAVTPPALAQSASLSPAVLQLPQQLRGSELLERTSAVERTDHRVLATLSYSRRIAGLLEALASFNW